MKIRSDAQTSHVMFRLLPISSHFTLFNTSSEGIKMFAPFENVIETPKKKMKMFLGYRGLDTPRPIHDDTFKLLLNKYPPGARLKMGLVVPFAKEITDRRISHLEAEIKEIRTRFGKEMDMLSQEKIDRLLKEKNYWIEEFHSTYRNEHEKNERRYLCQWTTEEKRGRMWVGGVQKDPESASEVKIAGSALTWLLTLAFCRFTLSRDQLRTLFL